MPQYNVLALFSIIFIICYEQEFLKGEPGSTNQSRKLLGHIQMTSADTTPLLCSDTQGEISPRSEPQLNPPAPFSSPSPADTEMEELSLWIASRLPRSCLLQGPSATPSAPPSRKPILHGLSKTQY